MPLPILGAVEIAAPDGSSFETPAAVSAADVFPGGKLQGRGWSIAPEGWNDGIYTTWVVTSDAGSERITGTDRAAARLLEIEAVQWLREVSRGREFAAGLQEAGKMRIDAMKQIARDPVRTAKQLPGGAARFLGRVGETVRHTVEGTLDVDETATPEQQARRAVGAERAKRALAAELGVNPFTTDQDLQTLLDEVSLVRSMGRVTVDAGSFLLLPGAISHAMTGVNVTAYLTKEQIVSEPRELEKMNRLRALEQGVPATTISAFEANRFYDPWTRAAIWNSLRAAAGVNPAPFIDKAANANSDLDAFFFVRTARMIALMGERGTKINEFVPLRTMVACATADGQLIVPLWLDYAIWTPDAKTAIERLKATAAERGATRIALVTNGTFSQKTQQELQMMGIETMSSFGR